jgi:SAM-dependent methyltransferase
VPSTARLPTNIRVFISYAHDNATHKNRVQLLHDTLRKQGIDARIDIPAALQRQDWPLWMLDQFTAADFVLVIASPEYKRRAEGRAPPGEGLGVQWETSLIRNDIFGNPRAAVRRYLPIVLPGCSVSDIPIWMGPNSATHYTVTGYTVEETAELTRVLKQRLDGPPRSLKPFHQRPSKQIVPPESISNKLRRDIVLRLADCSMERDTAMIHADIQQLLLVGGLGIVPADIRAEYNSTCARIDVESAYTAVEVCRDLRAPSALTTASYRLRSYLENKAHQTSGRYAGIITDGVEWHVCLVLNDALVDLASIVTGTSDAGVNRLLIWLESALTTGQAIKPAPKEIVGRLGVDSPGHLLDEAELTALYGLHRGLPHVQVKRNMWARLLTTASGTNFVDDDALFVNHTLLVAMAKIIGHAVINLHPESANITAGSIMSGSHFYRSQIRGVIERDFFDWIVDIPDGERFIKSLARRLTRFEWGEVEHDVLKLLYESIISPETRKQLGEHYTPDWLAEEIITDCITEPLEQRVLDASCGSGTFLFHAVRRYLSAADKARVHDAEAISGVVKHVFGIDVHPVAVTLARVTYLLAIGMDRLSSDRHPPFAVPVFLGDSLKWGKNQALWSYEGLSIPTDDDYEMFVNDPGQVEDSNSKDRLRFPDRIVADTERFDALVNDLANKASGRDRHDPRPSLTQVFVNFSIDKGDRAIIQKTFENMCDLHDDGRDHIWGYYVRNLARPAWLAQPDNRLDVLVGNPPWLAYRYMTRRQQEAFNQMCEERGLREGAKFAPTQDLSALFVTRCVEQYLKPGGRFGFVMPGAVLTLDHYKGFRTGIYGGKVEPVRVRFERPWDLHRIKPKFFSQHVSVVLGGRARTGEGARPLSQVSEVWSGKFATSTASKVEAEASITRTIAELPPIWAAAGSAYAPRFHQGVTFVPQFAFLLEVDDQGPLGAGIGRKAMQSRRSSNEHAPWAGLDSLHETIEDKFLRPVYLGESMVPFRLLDPVQAVIPWDGTRLLRGREADMSAYSGLGEWWRHAEAIWNEYRSNDRISFRARLDFQRGLSKQLPPPKIRVVYNKSGKFLASAIVEDPEAVIAQQLYWGAVSTLEEARFITAILNSTTLTQALGPLQSRGENSSRDFAKLPFRLPIPIYSATDSDHMRLVLLAERAENIAKSAVLPRRDFKDLRAYIRDLLMIDGIAADIDSIVKRLLYRDPSRRREFPL